MTEKEILKLFDLPWREIAKKSAGNALCAPGAHVFVRGLIEFSNICRRNCLYCGLRVQNRHLQRYIMPQEKILAAAKNAAAAGVDTIVLQSGEGGCQVEWLAEVVKAIKTETGLPVTLSVGERPAREYEIWREAGADRYLLKHETSDPILYARLHPGYALSDRLACLELLHNLGYEIGSGFMVGLPGQTLDSIARDILLCQELHVEMCGIGPFIAQKNTPLANEPSGSADFSLQILSILRLALPLANLPATTALASVDSQCGQVNGLLAGANVLMPVFTPETQANNYVIYDGKNRVSAANAARAIELAGRSHGLKV